MENSHFQIEPLPVPAPIPTQTQQNDKDYFSPMYEKPSVPMIVRESVVMRDNVERSEATSKSNSTIYNESPTLNQENENAIRKKRDLEKWSMNFSTLTHAKEETF